MSENVEALARTSVTIDDVYRITLCGSTRFRDEYELWNKRLTLAGFLVYSVSGFGHAGDTFTSEEKDRLDQVHLAKIDASHAIVVINPGGYVGDSTRREIAHATAAGKGVFYTDQGCPTVYKLRTGPHGSRSMRYRAFDYAARAAPVVDREAVARIINSLNPTGGEIRVSVPALELALVKALSPATSPGEGASSANRAARIASDHAASETLRKSEKPVNTEPSGEWRHYTSMPKDGRWFYARTAEGQERLVHYADKYDRLPICDQGIVWSTFPVEWCEPTPTPDDAGGGDPARPADSS